MKNPKHFLQQGMTLIEISVVLLVLIALAGIATPYFGNTGRIAMCQATDATLQTVKQAIMGGSVGPGFYGDNFYFPAVVKGGDLYSLHFLFSPKNIDASAVAWTAFNPKTAVGWRGPYLQTGLSLDTSTLNALDTTFGDETLATVFDPLNPTVDAYVHINMRTYDGDDANTTKSDTEASQLVHVLDAWHRPIVLQIPYDGAKLDPTFARLVSAGPGANAKLDTKIQDVNANNRNDDRVLYLQIPDPNANGNLPCD